MGYSSLSINKAQNGQSSICMCPLFMNVRSYVLSLLLLYNLFSWWIYCAQCWYNKRETLSWRLDNGSVKNIPLESNRDKSPHNMRTPDLTWFNKNAYVHGEEGRNYIENREENTRVPRILSHTTLNSENISWTWLAFKCHLKRFI